MIARFSKQWFKRQSVPDKIRLLIVLTAAAALVVAIGLLSALEIVGYRQQLANSIATLTQVTAANATAATEFQDPSVAHTLVSSLTSEPAIDSARIFAANGLLLASHDARVERNDAARPSDVAPTLALLKKEHRAVFADATRLPRNTTQTAFHGDHLDAIAPIGLDGEVIGYVHVQANLSRMYETLALYAWTALVIVLAAMGIAYAATTRMRESLSAPLLNLVKIMDQVSTQSDYKVRVDKTGNDEIGALVDGFNEMLEQIQERDRRLASHRRYLERQIAQRTAHLEKALDDARLASKAKSEFLARMSHEIRTPMNGVLGMTELLRNSALDVRQRRLVDTVYRSGESLLQIINDILDFSKVEAGRLQLVQVEFNLRDTVEEACELLSERADIKQLELICAIDNKLPLWFSGDPLRLKQVLINLIGNAIKFTERGQIVVRATLAPQSSRLRFEVCDTGPGIAQDDRQQLFEAFTQVGALTTRAHGGTGLGLAIARELVTLMNGEIGVQSYLGHGAQFWFEVPLPTAPAPAATDSPRATLTDVRALVADDNVASREVLRQHLSGWGIAVSHCADGTEALAMLDAAVKAGQPFDVVLLDHKMPKMDGLACLQKIRGTAALAATRAILLGSMDLALRNVDDTAVKADESLTKPVRQARLHAALYRVLDRDVSMHTMQMRAFTPQPPSPSSSPKKLGNVRLLLVEDNDVNREVALGMLDVLECDVHIAVDGAQAVELCTHDTFDVVLMDCHMPVLDGYAATSAIRALEVRQARTRMPILALTANAMEGGRDRCLAAGMDDFLVKPFTMTQLRELLERWAGKPLAQRPRLPLQSTDAREATLNSRAIDDIHALRSPNLVHRIVELFATHTPHLIAKGHAAVQANDLATLAIAAHELKSSSANLGGERLARICKDCELAARSSDTAHAKASWIELCNEYSRFCDSLQQLRQHDILQQAAS